MRAPVLTIGIVMLILALGSAAMTGFTTQVRAAGSIWSKVEQNGVVSPIRAWEAATGKTYTTSAPGKWGTLVAPLGLASIDGFEAGDAIRVCLDGPGCKVYAVRVIQSISGTDVVLDTPVTLTSPYGSVVETPVGQTRRAPGAQDTF